MSLRILHIPIALLVVVITASTTQNVASSAIVMKGTVESRSHSRPGEIIFRQPNKGLIKQTTITRGTNGVTAWAQTAKGVTETTGGGLRTPEIKQNDQKESLRLQGKVLGIRKTVERSSDVFDLDLELEFVNVGARPIILLRGPYGKGEWWLQNTQLSLEPANAKTVIFTQGTRPANSHSMSKWRELRAQLNHPNPPNNRTYLIAPGEKVVYHMSTFVTVSGNDRKMLDRQLWLAVELEMWPLNIERGFDRTDFRDLLTKRWSKQGVLRGDPITSEPIPVSLQP